MAKYVKKPAPTIGPSLPERLCLRCRKPFTPEHKTNFICAMCTVRIKYNDTAVDLEKDTNKTKSARKPE